VFDSPSYNQISCMTSWVNGLSEKTLALGSSVNRGTCLLAKGGTVG
jgi:hypothetical protein